MCQCFYCKRGKLNTPSTVNSFEEFVDFTTVSCKLGLRTGCLYCPKFIDVDDKEDK